MNYTALLNRCRCTILIACGFTLFLSVAQPCIYAQPKHHITVEGAPFITFLWNTSPTRSGTMLEWQFTNNSDSLINCNYSILTELGEKIYGRMRLLPRKSQLAGWKIEGISVISVSLTKITIMPTTEHYNGTARSPR